MKPEQVDYLIAEFEKRASAALDEDDMKKWHELADLHKSLLDWKEQLKNGLDEPCPVDYAKYGIELPENIPSRRKEAGQQVAPVSTTAAGTRPIGGEKPTAIEKKGSPPRKPLSRKATGRSDGIAPAEVNATKEKASRPGIIEESVRQP